MTAIIDIRHDRADAHAGTGPAPQGPRQMTRNTHTPGAPRAYLKTDVCAFRFTNAEWGLFSNFAALPVSIAAGDWFFPTSEHLFQAAKFPARPDLQALIAAQPTPALAAKIGRTAAPLTPTWHTDRVAVMRWAIRRKRETLPDRFDALFRRTADRPIVEFSSRDTYWGARANATHYIGANVLGRLWMELRHHAAVDHPRLPSAAYCDSGRLGALAR